MGVYVGVVKGNVVVVEYFVEYDFDVVVVFRYVLFGFGVVDCICY